MSLSAQQQSQLRIYLGYPARFHQTQPELEQAILALVGVPADETEVASLLTKLTDPTTGIDFRLGDALDRLQASKVGSIELNPAEIGMLRSEGRRIVARIAHLMGVTVRGDAFAGKGPINNDFHQG
jgi:hypothetical protein